MRQSSLRFRGAVLAVSLAVSGCTADVSGPDTSAALPAPTTAPTTSSTATAAPTTTSTTAADSVQRRITATTVFEPGTVYRGSLPDVGVSFDLAFTLDGWRAIALPTNRRVFVEIWNREHRPTGATVAVIAWNAELDIRDVADRHRSLATVADSTEPEQVSVAGSDTGVRFDLLLAPDPTAVPREDGCIGEALIGDNDPNTGNLYFAGPLACTWVRIWVIDVDGLSVSVIGQAAWDTRDGEWNLDPDNVWQIADFEPLLDDFIDALRFCTQASPCGG